VIFAICAKTIAIIEGFLPPNRRMERFYRFVTLERSLLAGLAGLLIGVVLLGDAVNQWRLYEFGDLDYTRTMRLVVPGVLFTALGFQTLLGSFLIGIVRTMRL
jgi:hypothetical protein